MDTRSRILAAALQLFAQRGFYGASIDQIAAEVGLTKQALIHHFGSKEGLYAAVLESISDELIAVVAKASSADNSDAFSEVLNAIYERTQKHSAETRILMRELLDNGQRAAQVKTWYLKPFLDSLAALLRRYPQWQGASEAAVAAHVYQLLGAVNYFAVSTVTLDNMYSKRQVAAMRKQFPAALQRLSQVSTQDLS